MGYFRQTESNQPEFLLGWFDRTPGQEGMIRFDFTCLVGKTAPSTSLLRYSDSAATGEFMRRVQQLQENY